MLPRDIPSTSGIYRITCIPTSKIYVGSAVNLYSRWIKHRSLLRQNRHPNAKLQYAWNKYGEEAFVFDILELVLVPEMLTAREQHYFSILDPFGDHGFNFAPVAGSRLGHKQPTETIEKIRKVSLGRKYPADFGQKISQRQLGQNLSLQRRQNISAAKRGKPSTRVGWKPTPEQVEQHRQAMTGYKQTEEHKHNAAAARIGKNRSPETREKMRLAALGHAPTNAKTFIVTSPDGTEYTVTGLKGFCREHHLHASTLIEVAKGKRAHHKGWTARYPNTDAS